MAELDGSPFPMEVRHVVPGERLLVAVPECPAVDGRAVTVEDCMWVSYRMVTRSGDGLTVAQYGMGEDGDPERGARLLLDAVAEKLSRTVG